MVIISAMRDGKGLHSIHSEYQIIYSIPRLGTQNECNHVATDAGEL